MIRDEIYQMYVIGPGPIQFVTWEDVFVKKIKTGKIFISELEKLKKRDLEILTENFPFAYSKKMKKSELIDFLLGEKKAKEQRLNKLAARVLRGY